MSEINQLSASDLANKIANKELASTIVTKAFLDQIRKVNPVINAIHQVDEDRVLQEAAKADAMIAKGQPIGRLHGVPISIKNHCKISGFECNKGSNYFASYIPNEDATIVKRLKEEGAIILGVTNVPEMLIAYEADNLIYGRTNNPYDLTRTPGGSSGGEAALIAALGSPLGIGSDAGGSVRVPAHYSGICAFKPTRGLIPKTGLIPADDVGLLKEIFCFGPMSRYVDDLILATDIMQGEDGVDHDVRPVIFKNKEKVMSSLKIAYLLDNGVVSVDNDTAKALKHVISDIANAMDISNNPALSILKETFQLHWETFAYGGDAGRGIANFMNSKPNIEFSKIYQSFFQQAQRVELTLTELRTRFMRIDTYRRTLLTVMQEFDVLLCPVSATSARLHGTTSDHLLEYTYSTMFNLLGWPAVVIPIGKTTEGLPIGMQIAAKPYNDYLALTYAKFLQNELQFMPEPNL